MLDAGTLVLSLIEEDTELRLVHDCVSQVMKQREASVQEGGLRWGCCGGDGDMGLMGTTRLILAG